MRMKCELLLGCLLLSCLQPLKAKDGVPFEQIKVSENHRFLTHQEGKPFFYLGDTAWELFHRLNREEGRSYLQDRAKKGFTVIQAVAVADLRMPVRDSIFRFHNRKDYQDL